MRPWLALPFTFWCVIALRTNLPSLTGFSHFLGPLSSLRYTQPLIDTDVETGSWGQRLRAENRPREFTRNEGIE